MTFRLIPVNISVTATGPLFAIARTAEDVSYESVQTFEHVIVPLDYQPNYPYDASGKTEAGPEMPFVYPLIVLTAITAQNQTIRLGAGVNIVAQTNPMLLAKQGAGLDLISNGRFILGSGIG